MIRWQLSEHASYLRYILPCSVSCHETVTTVVACFIPKGYITMLWPLSWDDDNCRSMFHTYGINYHALTAVMRQWQPSEHVSYLRVILPCSDRCHATITTVGACFIPKGYITMLCPLSWYDDNTTAGASFVPKGYITMLWPLSSDD